MRIRVILLVLAGATWSVGAQQPEMPRFRSGANLVRVDAYVTKDGAALTDLRPEDIEVYEDDKLQKIDSVELVEARGPIPQTERINPATVRDMRQDAADAARLFTLFFDRFHVSVAGSYHANKPIVDTLDKVIGRDDLVGVMTPEMSPTSITYSRRTSNIERYVTDTWAWGIKDQVVTHSPLEQTFMECYPPGLKYGYTADEMIARMREQQTLDALDGLVTHLGGLRPERKFVLVFTEGWPLYQRDERLARPFDDRVPGQDPLRADPSTGRIATPGSPDTERGMLATFQACERQRTMLAAIDHQTEFRTLLQRANRANISFYPVDARGLLVFDQPARFDLPPSVDRAWLNKRWEDLRTMAAQTDGVAVLDTNNIDAAMQRIFADVGSYYLLSYYSSNTRLDGKFRRIRVEVKRDGAGVRARPGYLAPTEAEARAAGGMTEASAGRRAAPPPPTVTRALDAVAPGRGNLPVRIQAAGARSSIRAVVELDAATARLPEWMSGGELRLVITPDRGTTASTQTITTAIEPGQRSIPIGGTDAPLPPGRYSVRAELMPKAGRLPIQVTTFATVPPDGAEVGTAALALRRGPSTGLAYIPTADPRFRRTERLRVEVPLMGEGFTGSARLLTREGHPMSLGATYTTRVEDGKALTLAVAEVVLAPLAAGEYVFELSLAKDGKTDIATYGFRIVP